MSLFFVEITEKYTKEGETLTRNRSILSSTILGVIEESDGTGTLKLAKQGFLDMPIGINTVHTYQDLCFSIATMTSSINVEEDRISRNERNRA